MSLRVRVSGDLESDLERVINGVRVAGPADGRWAARDDLAASPGGGLCAPETNRPFDLVVGREAGPWQEFGGLRVTSVPEGSVAGALSYSTPTRGLVETVESGRWSYRYDWRFPDGDSWPFTVRVTCGELAPQDAAGLRAFVAEAGAEPLRPTPYEMPGGEPAFAVTDHFDAPGFGRRVAWLHRPGAVIEVSVSPGLDADIDDLVAGVQVGAQRA